LASETGTAVPLDGIESLLDIADIAAMNSKPGG